MPLLTESYLICTSQPLDVTFGRVISPAVEKLELTSIFWASHAGRQTLKHAKDPFPFLILVQVQNFLQTKAKKSLKILTKRKRTNNDLQN